MSPYLVTKFLRPIKDLLMSTFPRCDFFFYLDDILITSDDFEVASEALQTTKKWLEQCGLPVNHEKSSKSVSEEVTWLGFTYSKGTLA